MGLLVVQGGFIKANPNHDNGRLFYSDDPITINISQFLKNGVYIIKDVIDLKGKTWYLPQDITLIIDKGLIKNGIIKGNNTKLSSNGVVFDKVRITGSWIVPLINTSMFADLSYINSLKDVFALANPEINNDIYIGYGLYTVSVLNNYDNCINICSNTNVTIDGTIILNPNDYPEFSIVSISGENVVLNGKGTIVGDKDTHLNEMGEWGMGILIRNSHNVKISGLCVRDCWGDCVYIVGNSNDISIKGCFLDNGRRQGISVISATNVNIQNTTICNVGGTDPQYAIDIEPNVGDVVDDVFIENVYSINCQGGFMSYGKAKNAMIGRIEIKNCIIEGSNLCPILFENGKSITVENNRLISNNRKYMIVINDIDSVIISNNTIVKNPGMEFDKAIVVNNSKDKIIKNNLMY